MRYKVETITPEKARKWLDATEASGLPVRPVRRTRVEKLAHAITTDQWLVTSQGVALTREGWVVDGRHRLTAIAEAGQAVDVLVIRDVEADTFKVLDTGAVRTVGDSLTIAGYSDVNVLSAAVRGWMTYDQLIGTTHPHRHVTSVLTTADVLEFLDDDENRRVAVAACSEGRRVANQLARHGLVTALAIALMTVRLRPNELGNTTVAEFYARLGDGVSLPADSPILALRRWLMSDTGYARIPNRERRMTATANILKAANDYALGKPRTIVSFRMGVEPYPAPLVKGTRVAYERTLADQERADAAAG